MKTTKRTKSAGGKAATRAATRAAISAETKKKPFGFEVSYELYNARGERLRDVLLRENPGSGQALQLDIVNTLPDERITLNTLQSASVRAFHVRLHFAPGIAADREVEVTGADWDVTRVASEKGTDVYLAWKSASVTLAPAERLVVVLQGVSAGPEASAEVTMQIDWPEPDTSPNSVRALVIRGPGEGDYELEANLVLGIRDRRGRPDIPLRAVFVGPNQVINTDGVQSTLVLRIINSARGSGGETVRFRYDTIESELTSRLVVALPMGQTGTRPWALGDKSYLLGVAVTKTAGSGDWKVAPARQNGYQDALEWEITPTQNVDLAPGESFDLTLAKIVTAHPSGIANLELRYAAVPGYWDGEMLCPIEKAPLVFGRDANKANVGIGNSQPDARLYLRNGHLRLDRAEVQHEGPLVFRSDVDNSGDAQSVRFFKKDETTPMLELLSTGQLVLRDTEHHDGFIHTDGKKAIGTSLQLGYCTIGTQSNDDLFLCVNNATKAHVCADGTFKIYGRFTDGGGFVTPVGTIVAYGGSKAPQGWLLCDGAEHETFGSYAELAALLGTTYGSASSGNFRVPDLRKRVPIGVDGTSTYKLGAHGGEETVTLTSAQMPGHSHGITDPGHTHSLYLNKGSGYLSRPSDGGASNNEGHEDTKSATTGISIHNSGGDQPHNNMPPFLAINYIIKF